MLTFTLSVICLTFGLQTLYFLWRFALHRKLPSLCCASHTLGWALLLLREMHLLPRWSAEVLLSAGFTVGALSLGIILIHEAHQIRPFR